MNILFISIIFYHFISKQMYISLHSFGQKILYPWAYTSRPIEDWHELHVIAKQFAAKVYNFSRGRYVYEVCLNLTISSCIKYIANNINIRFQHEIKFKLFLYKVGSSDGKINYNSYGNADDWARGVVGIKWTFLIELPPARNLFSPAQQIRGFMLPSKQILPVASSVFQGFQQMISSIRQLGFGKL